MTKIIALANQKGGVGKTTTAVNLGIGLARQGKMVLLVHADSQGNLTDSLGWKSPDELPVSCRPVELLRTVLRRSVSVAGRCGHINNSGVLERNTCISRCEP